MPTIKHPDKSGGRALCHLCHPMNQSTMILGEHWCLLPGTHNSVFEALSIAFATQHRFRDPAAISLFLFIRGTNGDERACSLDNGFSDPQG